MRGYHVEIIRLLPTPGVRSAARPAIGAGADGPAKPELLGRACLMAVGAEAADVAVVVAATMGERHDVVGHCGFPNYASACAVPAEGLGLQSSLALHDCSTSPQSLCHAQRLKGNTPGSGWAPGAIPIPLFRNNARIRPEKQGKRGFSGFRSALCGVCPAPCRTVLPAHQGQS